MQSPLCLPEIVDRLELSKPQCFCPAGRRREVDPITGRVVAIVPARQARHFEHRENDPALLRTERGECLFCRFATPSTLFFIDPDESIRVPCEHESMEAARRFLEGRVPYRIETHYDLVQALAPLNVSGDRHLARVFRNLTPATDTAIGEWCTVTALNPSYHDYEFHDLPNPAVRALVRSWQVQEAVARAQRLTFVGFVNGGKRRESGQSVACCHGQSYGVRKAPTLYEHISDRRERVHGGACPVCRELLNAEIVATYGVWCPEDSEVVVLAHPAPLHNWSLLVLPRAHVEDIGDINAAHFASALQAAIRGLRGQFGGEPAFNVVLRVGPAVGHVHAEIVPRTSVNILAGWEIAGHEIVITVDPRSIAAELSLRVP